jgi:hypothetical protein
MALPVASSSGCYEIFSLNHSSEVSMGNPQVKERNILGSVFCLARGNGSIGAVWFETGVGRSIEIVHLGTSTASLYNFVFQINLSRARTHTHTHVYTHTHTHTSTHTRAFTCIHTHAHARASFHLHTHPYTHAHTHIYTHARTCTHRRARVHTHTHTHTQTPIHTHTYTHTHACPCTHTHTHTHTHTLPVLKPLSHNSGIGFMPDKEDLTVDQSIFNVLHVNKLWFCTALTKRNMRALAIHTVLITPSRQSRELWTSSTR